jgi:hypothetical protein
VLCVAVLLVLLCLPALCAGKAQAAATPAGPAVSNMLPQRFVCFAAVLDTAVTAQLAWPVLPTAATIRSPPFNPQTPDCVPAFVPVPFSS